MPVLSLLLGVLLPLASSTATVDCPCLAAFPAGIDPSAGVSIGGLSYVYPATYGLSQCAQHDNGLEPVCDAATNKPSWCHEQWCYVDRASCNLPTTSSSYFPGTELHFSYQTCGAVDTFSEWFGDEQGSGTYGDNQPPTSPPHVVGDLVTVIHNYLISLSGTLEENEPEVKSLTSCSTGAPSSCPCTTCRHDTEASVFWTNSSWTLATWNASGDQTAPPLAFDFATVSLTASGDPTSADGVLETCLSGYLENAFLRVAAREASITTRIGYEYAAFQAQGNYVQWPAIQWCTDSYDPRFRSWYVSAASGPKDVIVVLDVSGSMRNEGRMQIMKAAADRLLDTFTNADYIGLVAFSSEAGAALGYTQLVRATDGARVAFKQWVNDLSPSGTTNFKGAFEFAFDMLEDSDASGATSGCTKAILFLSDGHPDEFSASDQDRLVAASEAVGGVSIFTYALGNGATLDVLKQIACRNAGALWTVADGGSLADAMADYYTFLAPLQEPCQVRWTYYNDWSSGVPLLAACLATFKKDSASDPTSCAEGTAGCMAPLLGVACMDVSLLATQAMIDARPDAASFYERVTADQVACKRRTPTPAQLQMLRSRISFGDAVCSAADLGLSRAPEPSSCGDGTGAGGGSGGNRSAPGDGGDGTEEEAAGTSSTGMIVGAVVGIVVVGGAALHIVRRLMVSKPTSASDARARHAASTASAATASTPPPVVPAVAAVPMGAPVVQMSSTAGYPQPMGAYPQPPIVVGTAVPVPGGRA